MITYPDTPVNIPAVEPYRCQDGQSSGPAAVEWAPGLFLIPEVPGSNPLIERVCGLRQFINLNALSRLRHVISSQIQHSQSSTHQIVCKLRLSWQIARTGIRQRVTVTH
jgi:hypothetical protein